MVQKTALQQAVDHHQAGHYEEALRGYQALLAESPENTSVLNLIGVLENQKGNHQQALEYLNKAIAGNSKHPSLFINLGVAYDGLADLESAKQCYQQGLALEPGNLQLTYNLALVFHKQQDYTAAAQLYQDVVQANPQQVDAVNNLGLCLLELGKCQQAIQIYQQTLKRLPQHLPQYAGLQRNLAIAYHKTPDTYALARDILQTLVRKDPNDHLAWNILGNVLLDMGQLVEAVTALHHAVRLAPNIATYHFNLGTAFKTQNNLLQAIKQYDIALQLDAHLAEARYNQAQCYFLLGDWQTAWPAYESRWQVQTFATPLRYQQYPRWQGNDKAGLKLLLWPEQGVGDQIMFISMLPDLLAAELQVTVECEQRLIPLFERAFPSVNFIHPEQSPPGFDVQIPMGSLGGYFRNQAQDFPREACYLRACPEQTQAFKNKYNALFPGKKQVGISWKSGNKENGQVRSCELEHWQSLFARDDIQLISLQYGDVKHEVEQYNQTVNHPLYIDEQVDPLQNLDQFAAQIAALDYVVSVDNSTVHLAGALGIPVYTLLCTLPDWRWGQQGSQTEWYPNMQLLRQQHAGEWETVFHFD